MASVPTPANELIRNSAQHVRVSNGGATRPQPHRC